ncbi:inorganic phosphate transporter [Magnetofaba australis]|uniref:Phosphate transporter n=1 Tax=Magnetofaba australis IT-1 TaxID=1434232 RepID=A0A1Y2K553_9PROT|nr:inorganic phosphate transporter [Magnetofaba australis]OSM04389.1 putative phosphate transporter [Magnetofaba australis IT-1]
MEIHDINKIEQATHWGRKELGRLGLGILFIIGVMVYASNIASPDVNIMLVAAAMIGGYMAMNIGANDVANNVGPAVGSRALSLTGAILIAAIFEAAGALIAGGDVVGTIRKGIIDPAMIPNPETFVWLMMGALLAAAIWLNLATALGAPVSTTHSIVGGVLGAGIAAGGWHIANWAKVGQIAASWVISPVLGGAIAAFFLFIIKRKITYQEDMISASKRMVPLLVALMTWAFSSYLIMKGLKKIWKTDVLTAMGVGLCIAVAVYLILLPVIGRAAKSMSNNKESVNSLFTIPLIFAAALLSFAHGANDVANAVGPLAAINGVLSSGGMTAKAAIPLWVMVVGAIGISIGLALYGPRLIRTVGSEITELDQSRAFCIAMAAAITVIIASQLGLPVSSTHIAVGGVFGVGFLREYLKICYARMVEEIREHHAEEEQEELQAYLERFKNASIDEKGRMLKQLKESRSQLALTKREKKGLRRIYREQLVRRDHVYKIAAAWVITVPASGLLAAMFYFMLRGMLLP